MTYNPSVPASGQSLGETRLPIQTNFANINTAFSVNHSPLTTNTDGKHLFLQMPEQVSAPTTAANEAGFYSKAQSFAGSGNTVTSLFMRLEGSGSEILLTGEKAPTIASEGQTFLPGGLLMKWGTTAATSSSTVTVTYAVGGDFTPFSVAPYTIQVTRQHASSSPGSTFSFWVITGFGATSFQIKNDDGHTWSYNWLAIGKA